MNIQHQDDRQTGAFFLLSEQGERIAEMTYFWNTADCISIDHTFVDHTLRGQGIAKQLFDAAITFAREQHIKVIPICSYAVVMFQRDQTLHDILAEPS
ncbi:MAG: N-acetyltransferase [Acinetobacter sp.]|nr:MAG: N-acetyltransferase [Acinetobacter sp.]